MIKVGLIGLPSCGKTTTAKAATKYTQGIYVPEIARHYIKSVGRAPNLTDQRIIAIEQSELEKSLEEDSDRIMFCDAPLIMCQAYNIIYNNNQLNNELRGVFESHTYDYVFRLSTLPYKEDGIRFQTEEDLLRLEYYLDNLPLDITYIENRKLSDRLEEIIKKII